MSVNGGGAMVREMVQEMPHTILSDGTSNYIRAAKLKAKLRQIFQREIKVHYECGRYHFQAPRLVTEAELSSIIEDEHVK